MYFDIDTGTMHISYWPTKEFFHYWPYFIFKKKAVYILNASECAFDF